MPQQYNTIQDVNRPENLPPWEYNWPYDGGCSSYRTYFGNTISAENAPTTGQGMYEPYEERKWRDTRRENGYRGRTFPPYRFTPFQCGTIKVQRHLIKKVEGSNSAVNVCYQEGATPKISGLCTRVVTRTFNKGPRYTQWVRCSHDYSAVTNYTVNNFVTSELNAALASVETDVSKDALCSFDLLTEIAELKDAPKLVKSASSDLLGVLRGLRNRYGRSVLRRAKFMTPYQMMRFADKAIRKLGDEWMTYRYGIMPLVYSYQDAQKAASRHATVKNRKGRAVSPTPTGVQVPGPTTQFRRTSYEGNVMFRGNVFSWYSSDELAKLAGMGTNPLVTIWELIPYSFVVDWFVNVGDYIARKTSANWSGQSWACLSRRESYTKKVELHRIANNKTLPVNNMYCTGWWGSSSMPTPSPVVLQDPEGYYPLEEVVTDTYSRWLFNLSGAQLTLRPSLNWRRMLDGAVMTNNQLRSFMRSL